MKVLFVNSCVRGKELSRSYHIAKRFITALQKESPETEIRELDLMAVNPPYMTYGNFSPRDSKAEAGDFDSPMFDLAKEFASYDRILIAAPFWEFSFPAILKAYIENIAVAGITFKYTEKGSAGMCKGDKMLYITTRGGYATGVDVHTECAVPYLRNLCNLFGIGQFDCIWAEGLDIEGNDPAALLESAVKDAQTRVQWFLE